MPVDCATRSRTSSGVSATPPTPSHRSGKCSVELFSLEQQQLLFKSNKGYECFRHHHHAPTQFPMPKTSRINQGRKLSMRTRMANPMAPKTKSPMPQMIAVWRNSCFEGFPSHANNSGPRAAGDLAELRPQSCPAALEPSSRRSCWRSFRQTWSNLGLPSHQPPHYNDSVAAKRDAGDRSLDAGPEQTCGHELSLSKGRS